MKPSNSEGRILRGYVYRPDVMDGVFAILAMMATVFWLTSWLTVDGSVYIVHSAMCALALVVIFAAWWEEDRRKGR